MHSIFNALNDIVSNLGKINPAWYVVIVGPLASALQHFIKKERELSKNQNLVLWLLISAVGGVFYSVMRSVNFQTFLTHFADSFPALTTTSYLTYRAVFEKYEQLASNAPAAPIAPVVTAAPEATPANF